MAQRSVCREIKPQHGEPLVPSRPSGVDSSAGEGAGVFKRCPRRLQQSWRLMLAEANCLRKESARILLDADEAIAVG